MGVGRCCSKVTGMIMFLLPELCHYHAGLCMTGLDGGLDKI
jgi:hypothetical protein